jgi:hypothetical protein
MTQAAFFASDSAAVQMPVKSGLRVSHSVLRMQRKEKMHRKEKRKRRKTH